MKWSGFLVLVLVFAGGCRCKHHTYLLTPTAKRYWTDFKEGSYWVFQNAEDAADVDTLTLINNKLGQEFSYAESECDGDYFEEVTYGLLSAKTGDTLNVKASARVTADMYSIRGMYHSVVVDAYASMDKSSGMFVGPPQDTITTHPNYPLGNIM
jgi:hypothetical protein